MKKLIALCAVLMLTACGQQADTQSSAPSETETAPNASASEPQTVVVYSSRQPHLIEPLFERFTEETGIRVEFSNDNEAALIERLAAEDDNTPADVLITVDAGNLWQAGERGLLQPIDSAALNGSVPASLRGTDNEWFGLSLRARSMVYHPDRVDPAELSTYEDLADPRWEGRLCLRTSRKVYNQSLVAMLIEHHGTERTEEIVSGWVSNLATTPFSSHSADRSRRGGSVRRRHRQHLLPGPQDGRRRELSGHPVLGQSGQHRCARQRVRRRCHDPRAQS